MRRKLTRRCFMLEAGIGSIVLSGAPNKASAQTLPKQPAVDRSQITDWGERPMYLRPYHPPYVVCYYARKQEAAFTSVKWDPLVSRVENEPDLMIRIIEAFDDACAGCSILQTDVRGSIWGVGHTCTSAEDTEMVELVTRTNKRILGELGLDFGDEISMREMVVLLDENVPELYEGIGGPGGQKLYQSGLEALKRKYNL